MATSFRRRLGFAERRAAGPESGSASWSWSWLAVLLQCVGVEKLLGLIDGTRLLGDLRCFRDYKPAASSSRAFDDGCFFCRARREKVKEHVAALNRRIVESGGKPLLTRDQSNVVRLEGQIEEFLGALVRRTEYKPRIPDPHIPVVARDVLLQIIHLFLVRFGPATPPTPDPAPCKPLMPDQDAPLDLSVRRVKSEPRDRDQDLVLDLSLKRSRGPETAGNAAPGDVTDRSDPGVADEGLSSVSSLEDLMGRLCPHHQRSVVDAFTFLEAELKADGGGAPEPGAAGQECLTLVIVKNRDSGHLEAKKVPEAGPGAIALGPDTEGVAVTPVSAAPSAEGSPRPLKTARKSVKVPRGRPGDDPDAGYDIVYVAKQAAECGGGGAGRRMGRAPPPRRNARKSTRGHRYLGACWELETVRTLARGNCATRMPEVTTSVTPRQALAKPDGVPARGRAEAPGDVVETTHEELVVEPSQTGRRVVVPEGGGARAEPRKRAEHSWGPILESRLPDTGPVSESRLPDTGPVSESRLSDAGPVSESRLSDAGPVSESSLSDAGPVSESSLSDAEPVSESRLSDVGPVLESRLSNAGAPDSLTQEALRVLTEDGLLSSESPPPFPPGGVEGLGRTPGGLTREAGRDLQGPGGSLGRRNGGGAEELPSSGASDGTLGETARDSAAALDQHLGIVDLMSASSGTPPGGGSGSGADRPAVPQSCGKVPASPPKTPEQVPMGSRGSVSVEQARPPEKPERMPLRSRGGPSAPRPCSAAPAGPPETQEQAPPKGGGSASVEEANLQESRGSPSVGYTERPERIPLRSRAGASVEQAVPPEKPERMPLRSRGGPGAEHPRACSAASSSPPETQERASPRGRGSTSVEQPSPPEKAERMRLRSRNGAGADIPGGPQPCRTPVGPERTPPRSKTAVSVRRSGLDGPRDPLQAGSPEEPGRRLSRGGTGTGPDPPVSPSVARRVERPERTPDRGGLSCELGDPQGCSGILGERQGRMSLRNRGGGSTAPGGNSAGLVGSPKPDPTHTSIRVPPRARSTRVPLRGRTHSDGEDAEATPGFGHVPLRPMSPPGVVPATPANPLRPSRKPSLRSFQEAGPGPGGWGVKGGGKARPTGAFTLFDVPPPGEAAPCRFMEALGGERGRRSLLELNSRFERVHRGWVHADRDGPPAARPRNRADRLKEIWGSRRRSKKARTPEQHRVSAVRMLFARPFDLPGVCRWFLQTTETRSLVIVKKVNTRLPSETHLGFPCFASPPGGPGAFPSLQAERLKKHLKKFAIMSPVRSNPKNKRLIAKALALGGRDPAAPPKPRGSGDAHNHAHLKRSPASARILRKYSNMREKKHVALKTRRRGLREAQVLTRSQGKLDIELSPTGVIRAPGRRGLAGPEPSPAKRSRAK